MKVVTSLLVPIISDSGTPIGVCQALNKKLDTTSTMQSFSDVAHFSQLDVKAATALASEVRHSKASTEKFEHLRDRRCPLDNVSSVLNLPDMHAKACFALKDGLGVALARVITIDHDMNQLKVIGERNTHFTDSFFPLAAKSLLAKNIKTTGHWELLRTPSADPDFNSHIDCNGGPAPDDMLIVPVPAATDASLNLSSRPDSGNSSVNIERHDARQILAVLQVLL